MKKIIIILSILLSFFILKSLFFKKPSIDTSKKQIDSTLNSSTMPKTPQEATKEALAKRNENMRRNFITRIQLMPKNSRRHYIDKMRNGELRDYPELVQELETYVNQDPLTTAPPMMIENFKRMFARMPKDKREARLEALSKTAPVFKRFPELKETLRKDLSSLDETMAIKRLPNPMVIDNFKNQMIGLSPNEKQRSIERLKQTSPLFRQFPDLEKELYK